MKDFFGRAAALLRSSFAASVSTQDNPYASTLSKEIDYAEHPETKDVYFRELAIALDLHPDKVTPLSMWVYKRTTPREVVEATMAKAHDAAKRHLQRAEFPAPAHE